MSSLDSFSMQVLCKQFHQEEILQKQSNILEGKCRYIFMASFWERTNMKFGF